MGLSFAKLLFFAGRHREKPVSYGRVDQQQPQQQPKRRYIMFNMFPLLSIPVIIYNVIAFGGGIFSPNSQSIVDNLNKKLFDVPMVSGTYWTVSSGDMLILIALVMLFAELLKSTSTGREAIANHALSLLLFIFCLIEFLLFGAFASSVFFIITVMTLLDVLAGFIVTIISARRDIGIGEGFGE